MAVVTFRAYRDSDRARCLELFDQNCPEDFAPNERADYASFLDAAPSGYRVGVCEDAIVAAFGLIAVGPAAHRRLNWILVARNTRGSGIGRAMMNEALDEARAGGVDVVDIAASHRSAPFFARFGARPVRQTEDGWGRGMHRVDMELRVSQTLFTGPAGTIEVPRLVLIDRADGGHLIVNPSRSVWERSELTREELMHWSFLVAATGRAMLEVLPQLEDGCINYWEAGNWALNDAADPAGPKVPRVHRRVHLHLLGRSPRARDADWQWGEAPRFPSFVERERWAEAFQPLVAAECEAVTQRAIELLRTQYGV